jgi:hypothetical protein
MKGIQLYLMLLPLAMWSGLSLVKRIQKEQMLNLFHLGAGMDNPYCTMFNEPSLSVNGTDSMKL